MSSTEQTSQTNPNRDSLTFAQVAGRVGAAVLLGMGIGNVGAGIGHTINAGIAAQTIRKADLEGLTVNSNVPVQLAESTKAAVTYYEKGLVEGSVATGLFALMDKRRRPKDMLEQNAMPDAQIGAPPDLAPIPQHQDGPGPDVSRELR